MLIGSVLLPGDIHAKRLTGMFAKCSTFTMSTCAHCSFFQRCLTCEILQYRTQGRYFFYVMYSIRGSTRDVTRSIHASDKRDWFTLVLSDSTQGRRLCPMTLTTRPRHVQAFTPQRFQPCATSHKREKTPCRVGPSSHQTLKCWPYDAKTHGTITLFFKAFTPYDKSKTVTTIVFCFHVNKTCALWYTDDRNVQNDQVLITGSYTHLLL